MAISDEVRPIGSRLQPADPLGGHFERTPPQDTAAEQCVLGGMLLSKDAIADVVEIVRTVDFYKPAHATVFDTILDLYGRGEPADAITVAAALTQSGELGKAGGAPYLHTLIASVPTAANAAYYARIVAERAVLRRLVEAGTRIVQLGYGVATGSGRDVHDAVDLAQQAVYDVTERRVSEDFAMLGDLLQPTLDEIESIGATSGEMTGAPTGFTDLDRLLNGLHPGQLVVVAGRPGLGKSTAALDFVRATSVRHGLSSLVFSLEMSKIEIVMRLLSAESRVPLHVLRSGQLSDDDWTKLARRMGEISEAPLFVDDTPNMTLMEIRAKARRLKQRHDLRLIIVDYLQLMTSPKRVESRQQEVAELSRGLKLLAKEVECPVVAVSQLNRGPEQRTDKRPQLSDLRESGCLTAETRLVRADTGAEITLGQLIDSGERDIPVWALDESLRYVPRTLTHAFPSGVKKTYRLRLASGRSVDATANHPFLTCDGWRALGELRTGMRLATPRHVPAPLVTKAWPDEQVVLLAHSIGAGSFVEFVPAEVFALPKKQVALFLRHLWATDGCVRWDDGTQQVRLYYASTSRRLVEDVALLLLRFGIHGRIKAIRKSGYRAEYQLLIYGGDDQLRFFRGVGVHEARVAHVDRCRAELETRRKNPNRDPVPVEVWDRVRGILTEDEISHRQFAASTGTQFCGSALRKHAPGRQRMAKIAAVLEDADLEMLATNDVYWDAIVAVEPLGERPVYDATVLGAHNFIANGISAHNSIEQDADVVILLHREDYYDKESPRAGEADFIVAKHRNGPTDTVTVAAQLHFSRFVDMAIV